MEKGRIVITPETLLRALGYKHVKADEIIVDMFSNQVIIDVSGACDLYPVSISPIPEYTAVTGL
ncbi:hypothetical protein A8709_32935 [Paenibacillus pectinilyticus]|uniref:Uncharacterized protein n=1 Tax=Paenibacillus pectinilyticus TaxID=512399 RepID=A0A1C0ZX56_9BACL|nr:hypothetical protein [Paenibacillus pectinilyticus]OCT12618.1 hypothetical protein A8709_32935 [Paenibacillus pectinilyticus]